MSEVTAKEFVKWANKKVSDKSGKCLVCGKRTATRNYYIRIPEKNLEIAGGFVHKKCRLAPESLEARDD